jgi:hypothetical protein
MINRLIDVALKNRFIVLVLYLGFAGWGWWALTSTPIDAIPDLSDNQVIVFTDWAGHSLRAASSSGPSVSALVSGQRQIQRAQRLHHRATDAARPPRPRKWSSASRAMSQHE